MKVKIIKCSYGIQSWYNDRIGESFDVENDIDTKYYKVPNSPRLIAKVDVEPETKDDISPLEVLSKHIPKGLLNDNGLQYVAKAMREYALIHAAKAWDAAVIYESQRDNFLNFCKPITAPNKEQYLQSLK